MKALGPNGRRLLRHEGDSFGPPAGARARVDRKLAARIGAAALGTVVAAETSTAAASAGGGASALGSWLAAPAAKVVAVVVVAATVAGGGLAARRSGAAGPVRAPEAPASAVASVAPAAERRPPDEHALAREASLATVTATAPAPDAPSAPLPVKRVPAPRASALVSANATALRASTTPQNEPSVQPPSAPSAAPLALASEAALLRDAQRARVSGDASRALALLDRYDGAHPRGVLAELARAERVLALCALGRGAEARTLASSAAALPLDPGALRACENH